MSRTNQNTILSKQLSKCLASIKTREGYELTTGC